jgi:hypothetical protein
MGVLTSAFASALGLLRGNWIWRGHHDNWDSCPLWDTVNVSNHEFTDDPLLNDGLVGFSDLRSQRTHPLTDVAMEGGSHWLNDRRPNAAWSRNADGTSRTISGCSEKIIAGVGTARGRIPNTPERATAASARLRIRSVCNIIHQLPRFPHSGTRQFEGH